MENVAAVVRTEAHPLEGPVLVPEIQHRGPVIREIFCKCARGAGRETWKVVCWVHRDVKAEREGGQGQVITWNGG